MSKCNRRRPCDMFLSSAEIQNTKRYKKGLQFVQTPAQIILQYRSAENTAAVVLSYCPFCGANTNFGVEVKPGVAYDPVHGILLTKTRIHTNTELPA